MTELQELKEKAEKAFAQIEDYQEFKQKYRTVKNKIDMIMTKIKRLERLEEEEQNYRWKPDKGEMFYVISSSGNVHSLMCGETANDIDDFLGIGNCFPTEESAEFAVERLKVLAEMRKFTFEPDWNNQLEYKYVIDLEDKKLRVMMFTRLNYGLPCFQSIEQAQACIDAIGEDRLKKYYFGVRE